MKTNEVGNILQSLPSNYHEQSQFLENIFKLNTPAIGYFGPIDKKTTHINVTKSHQNKQPTFEHQMLFMPWCDAIAWSQLVNSFEKLKQELIEQSNIKPLTKYFERIICQENNYQQEKTDGLNGAMSLLVQYKTIVSEEQFCQSIIPFMIDQIVSSEKIFNDWQQLPCLYEGSDICLTLSNQQCICLLIHAFFHTFYPFEPNRDNQKEKRYRSKENNRFTMLRLVRKHFNASKLACILGYIVHSYHHRKDHYSLNFYRAKITKSRHDIDKTFSALEGGSLAEFVASPQLPIEHFISCVQTDFADEFIGGLVLLDEFLQEEVMFSIRPELIVSILFTSQLQDDECMIFTGARSFSKFTGYDKTFKYKGADIEEVPQNADGSFMINICAIDAVNYFRSQSVQFQEKYIYRDIIKATCGFSYSNRFQNSKVNAIATGKWGCGVFKGDPELKFVIQLLAATLTKRSLIYCTFNDQMFTGRLVEFYKKIKNVPPHRLLDAICNLKKTHSVFDQICDKLKVLQQFLAYSMGIQIIAIIRSEDVTFVL